MLTTRYLRESALTLEQSGRRVEYGAIKINLDLFPAGGPRAKSCASTRPLGHILQRLRPPNSPAAPSAFLRMASDSFIDRRLGIEAPPVLYGRRNTLLDAWERPLAEIVEILPP